MSSALLLGALLVIAVLFLFLWDLRAAFTVALSLPLIALSAFVMMDLAEVTANLMSLGGLVTSTALTLIVLPVLYATVEQRAARRVAAARPGSPVS